MQNISKLTFMLLSTTALAQNDAQNIAEQIDKAVINPLLFEADANQANRNVSPVRRINRIRSNKVSDEPSTNESLTDGAINPRYRTIEGSHNNRSDVFMGAAEQQLLRLIEPDYEDGISGLSGQSRPSARAVSNAVSAQIGSIPNLKNASDYIWQWGQFLDHDITLSDGVDPAEPADIDVPIGDPYFDPAHTGEQTISLNRSIYDIATGTSVENPRQQINEITSWIDASNVYGSDEARAHALRTNDGSGRLKVSEGNLLPFNEEGLPNAGGDSPELFLAGDVRANEQVGLTAMHTLFVREHNWHARRIRQANRSLSGEEIYQRAREIVAAEMQAITYYEYLPTLLGRNALSRYQGYNADINGTIANVFSHAIFRYGHSALSPTLKRIDQQGNTIEAGDLPLRSAFFAPHRIIQEGGIEPLLRGLASQVSQQVDNYIIDDVRNFLFGPPGAGGFDLAALNIQRGRDHGLPSYNVVREAFGLPVANNFADITSDSVKQAALASVYNSVDDIDLWIGALSEDIVEGSMVGELLSAVLIEQFEALRDGDRFWYQNHMSREQQRRIRQTRLSDIIRRNTTIGREISDNVFRVRTEVN